MNGTDWLIACWFTFWVAVVVAFVLLALDGDRR